MTAVVMVMVTIRLRIDNSHLLYPDNHFYRYRHHDHHQYRFEYHNMQPRWYQLLMLS